MSGTRCALISIRLSRLKMALPTPQGAMSHTCARLSFKEKSDMTHAIRRAAVIGSGVMGGAIAAHLANVGVPVDLLDIAPRELTSDEEKKGLALHDRAV